MDTFRQDLLFAFRMLRKDRAYAAAVILTLAICLGANTAIFTVVRSVLLRPLPYPESEPPGLLVSTRSPAPASSAPARRCPTICDRVTLTDVFESVALYQRSGYKVGQGAGAEGVSAMNVTPVVLQGAADRRASRAASSSRTRGRRAATRSRC